MILFHNHPSGDPSPSTGDIAFTRRLAQAGDIVGVRLLDHIIVGEPPRYISLHQRGVVSGTPLSRGVDHLL
jgi:DNA repair protein RadC